MTTRLWDVQAALAALFADAAATATVFAGPRPRSGSAPRLFLLVGSDGGETGTETTDDGLTATQEPSAMGPGTWRDEQGRITCSAWAWSGNRSVTSARTAAQGLLAACEAAVDADRSLGGLLTADGRADLSSLSVLETQRQSGPVVRIVFDITYGALIQP